MCPRRRFYKGPVNKVNAGEKKRVLLHKGKICIKQLNLYYNGDDTTGTNQNKWVIKIDGEEILNEKFVDIYTHLAGYCSAEHSDRPVVVASYSTSSNVYIVIFHDLGPVEDSIEVWHENADASNHCWVAVGLVYDVLE